jgi:hypothetical protein
MNTQLKDSVGHLATNSPDDVLVVQRLLSKKGLNTGGADGKCGPRTKQAIITFQTAYFSQPDGRVDRDGKTWHYLSADAHKPVPPVSAPPKADGSLTRPLPRPSKDTINIGLKAVSNAYMVKTLGNPRDGYSQNCQPMTNVDLKKLVVSESVGPFRVTGLRPAVQSLKLVMADIAKEQPAVYTALGTAGMMCCRNVRGSTSAISNHSWGTAIDLTLNGQLDRRGDGQVQYGLAIIAPIFNRHGWFWGAAFRTEDAMHFEASQSLIESWLPGFKK